jgi:lipid A 4'-phosphatase
MVIGRAHCRGKESVMNTPAGPIMTYRRYWIPELAVLGALALGAVVLFASTDLDIITIKPYYHPELSSPWPVASELLWSLFYRSAPWVTGSLGIAGVGLIIAGILIENAKRLRLYGLFILLCIIIGPGLIINGVLKDHWGRPRPRQIVEFGGKLAYRQPLLPSRTYGKSFPCGHCSVGYLYAIGWWLWRRRHTRWAILSLTTGLALGTLLGIGRMAGGAHFLSDAVWSALIAVAVAHVLYYYILRIPAREDSFSALYPLIDRSRSLKTATTIIVVLLGAGIVAGGILANPHDADLTARVRISGYPIAPEKVELLIDTLDVEIRLVTEPSEEIECSGNIHGFGLPTNEISAGWSFDKLPVPTLRYRIAEKGWFTDMDGVVRLVIPVKNLRAIVVRVKQGDITVVDATTGALAASRMPTLDLRTAEGRVLRR